METGIENRNGSGNGRQSAPGLVIVASYSFHLTCDLIHFVRDGSI